MIVALLLVQSAFSGDSVSCTLVGDAAGIDSSGTLGATYINPGGIKIHTVSELWVRGGTFGVAVPSGFISAFVSVHGYIKEPLEIDPASGTCKVGPLRPAVRLSGHVEPAEPGTMVRGCGYVEREVVDQDGYFEFFANSGYCVLQAARTDDGTTAFSMPVLIDLSDPDPDIELVLPSRPAAGVGIRLRQSTETPPRIWAVKEESAAHRAGLRCGDQVTSIGDWETGRYAPEYLLALLVGEVGTSVTLGISPADPTVPPRTVALVREVSDAPDHRKVCPD